MIFLYYPPQALIVFRHPASVPDSEVNVFLDLLWVVDVWIVVEKNRQVTDMRILSVMGEGRERDPCPMTNPWLRHLDGISIRGRFNDSWPEI